MSSRQAEDWGDCPVPTVLPELLVTPTHMQVFMFSAATWNRHHIHYSRDAAVREGLPDVVVQRALVGNYLARLLTEWAGSAAEIAELSWKVVASAVPGRQLRCNGSIVDAERDDDARLLHCDLSVTDEAGTAIAHGRATLRQRAAA